MLAIVVLCLWWDRWSELLRRVVGKVGNAPAMLLTLQASITVTASYGPYAYFNIGEIICVKSLSLFPCSIYLIKRNYIWTMLLYNGIRRDQYEYFTFRHLQGILEQLNLSIFFLKGKPLISLNISTTTSYWNL